MSEINEKIPLVTFGIKEENDQYTINEKESKPETAIFEEGVIIQRRTNINEMNKVSLVTFDEDPGRTKPFLILLNGNNEDGEPFTEWNICKGRLEAYSYIKGYIEYIDLVESYIIGADEQVQNAVKVIDYLEHVLETGKIEDPGFDPRDYIPGDYLEDEEASYGEE